jgi:UDP-N-acetyl-D-mannosaminuronate dehydrogenase
VICIVGRGYVGLALAIQLFRSGAEGTGLQIDHRKVDQANRGHSYFKHLVGKTISKALKTRRLIPSTEFVKSRRPMASLFACQRHPTTIASRRRSDK